MKRVIIYVLLGIGIIIFGFGLIRYAPIPKNADMPMWFLKTRVSDVVRSYGKFTSTCSFIQQNELAWCIEATNENRKNLSNLNQDQGVLYINFKGRPQRYSEPIEIYAMFECFLYLDERTTPKDIVAVTCISQSGEWFDANSTGITITTNEFEELYSVVDSTSKTNSVIAKELADIWINKNFYNRYKLRIDEQQKYKELLVTQWRNIKQSYDGNFYMFYGYNNNRLSINSITKDANNGVSMSSSLLSFDIEEKGFLYGAWDGQNNIWLYGEEIGIRLYKFDSNKNWKQVENPNETQIPVALKKVLDTK